MVQGLGFRPFVYRLAKRLRLKGTVLNGPQGVEIAVEGEASSLREFERLLRSEKPPLSRLDQVEVRRLSPKGYPDFRILESSEEGDKSVLILPDLALCPDCRADILDPKNRRYGYPFTNCTNCGPRFSIIERLPYDRAHTGMRAFQMCPDCQREYEDPADRRFHAQPNACPLCGPQLELWDPEGTVLASREEALERAAQALKEGKILALKGLGGFQLLCDARNEQAVQELRSRKKREAKPLAVMFPDMESLQKACEVNKEEEKLLFSHAAPIVLLRKRSEPSPLVGEGRVRGVIQEGSHPHPGPLPSRERENQNTLAPGVAPGNTQWGAFLPYTPLHVLLLQKLGFPVVATSGNLTDEPLCTEGKEALERIKGIADFFLTHNRPIARPMDDSVARVVLGEVQILRRARGYAPLPVDLGGRPGSSWPWAASSRTPWPWPRATGSLSANTWATWAPFPPWKLLRSPSRTCPRFTKLRPFP